MNNVIRVVAATLAISSKAHALELGEADKFDVIERKLLQEGQRQICKASTLLDVDNKDASKRRHMQLKLTKSAKGVGYILLSDDEQTKEIVFGKMENAQTYRAADFVIPDDANENLARFIRIAKALNRGVVLHGRSVSDTGEVAGQITVVASTSTRGSISDEIVIFATGADGMVVIDKHPGVSAVCTTP